MKNVDRVIIFALVAVISAFTVGCSDKGSDAWAHELDLIVSGEQHIGRQAMVQGYFTEDGRLWLYQEDAHIERIEHSIQLEGISDELLHLCRDRFVTATGTVKQGRPAVIGDITALIGKGDCYYKSEDMD